MSVRFVRLYPSDWRSGCIGLTFEQEGLYIRVCAYIYETERRLPLDDKTAAKLMGAHTNAYRKVRDQLVSLGKLSHTADGWTVVRAEKELAAATHSQGQAKRQADQVSGRDTCQDTLGDTPHNTPIDTPIVFSENANEINGPLKSRSHNHRGKEEDRPVSSEVGVAREAADGQPSEVSGLNGATGTIVAGIALFLNQHAPDYETARRVVASNVGIYGADAVRDGYAELMADVDDNKVRIPSVKALVGYFKTASGRPGKTTAAPARMDWQTERAERARKSIERLKARATA